MHAWSMEDDLGGATLRFTALYDGGASSFGGGRMAGLAVFAGEISDADAATLAAAV